MDSVCSGEIMTNSQGAQFFCLASNHTIRMKDTMQINLHFGFLSFVSLRRTECYAQHLQNITLTVSLTFHLLKRRSRKLTHSVAAIFSYVLYIPWFLPLKVSPEQLLLGSCGGRAPRKLQDQEVPGKPGPRGLGAKQPVCVHKLKHTYSSVQGNLE